MSNIRADGRSATDLRPISIQLGQLARADGSARFSYGSTACLASFTGPIEVRIREEMPDTATLEVSHRPLGAVGATPSRALEAALESAFTPLLALSQHPRSLLQLVVQSLSAPPTSFEQLGSVASVRRNEEYLARSDYPSEADDIISGSGGDKDMETDTTTSRPSKRSVQHTWPKKFPATATASTGTPATASAPTTEISISERCAALNASALAVLDSGAIASSGVLVAISAALVGARANAYAYVDAGAAAEQEGEEEEEEELELVLDPTAEEEERAKARFGFGWAFGRGLSTVGQTGHGGQRGGEKEGEGGMDVEVDTKGQGEGEEGREGVLVWVESEGRLTREQFKEALAIARPAAEEVLEIYRIELQKHLESRQRPVQ